MRGNPQLHDTHPARRILRLLQRERVPVRTDRPTTVNDVILPHSIPLDDTTQARMGYSVKGSFSVGAAALDVGFLDISGFDNLHSSLGTAIQGGKLLWHATRNTTTNARNGAGEALIVANFYNGSGTGAAPHVWISATVNQGEAPADQLGLVPGASISGSNLVIYMTNRDGLGGTITGQYWWMPFYAVIATGP